MPDQKVALAIGAHPDDVEFMMAGTLALLKKRGWEVHILTIANGSCGTAEYDAEEIVRIRLAEAHEAARVLGGTYHPGLVPDLEVFYDAPTIRKATAVVREIRPNIVLTHSPVDYMEDHTNTCRIAVTACFCRLMRNWVTDPETATTDQELALYHCQPHGNRDPLRRLVVPELFVDVAGVLDLKLEMLRCHKSQKNWLDVSQGMDSYLVAMKELNAEIARLSGREGLEYAEGLRRHSHIGFTAEDTDPLREELADHIFVNPDYQKALDRAGGS